MPDDKVTVGRFASLRKRMRLFARGALDEFNMTKVKKPDRYLHAHARRRSRDNSRSALQADE